MDRYPMMVQTKGGQTQFLAKDLIITSNSQPWEWYNNEKIKHRMEPFYRRIDRWIALLRPGEPAIFETEADFAAYLYREKNPNMND